MARTLVCVRYFLVGGAVVLGFSGIAVGVSSSYFIYQLHEYAPLTPEDVCNSSAILLVMGLITCLVGWCAWQFLDFKHEPQVVTFAVVIGIISFIETSAGAWALVRHEQIDALPVAHLTKVFKLAVKDEKPLWDHMQSKLHCCGVNGPSDYHEQNSIPWSCCDTSLTNESSAKAGICTTIYAKGCHYVVVNRTRSILLHIFLLALCSVLFQICFIVCISCYVRAYKEKIKKRRDIILATARARDSVTSDKLLAREMRYPQLGET